MVTANTLADLCDQPAHTAEQQRKAKLAVDLLTRVFVCPEDFDAAPIGDVYVQHSPGVGDGKEALRCFAEKIVTAAPDAHLDIKRVLVDGDYVVVHSHVTWSPGDPGTALIDLFRVKDDTVVEHWDIMQQVPAESANDNTMF